MKGVIKMDDFGIRLNNLCDVFDYKKKEVSKMLGFSENTFGQYTRGKSYPDFETLIQIADLFHVSVDYLLRGREHGVDETYSKALLYIHEILSIFQKAGIELPYILEIEKWRNLSEEDLRDLTNYFHFTVNKSGKDAILEIT